MKTAKSEVVGSNLTGHLRLQRNYVTLVAINEAGLVLEDDQRIVDAAGEEGVAVMQLSGNDNRSAFVVDDARCVPGQRASGGRVVFILLADSERRSVKRSGSRHRRQTRASQQMGISTISYG